LSGGPRYSRDTYTRTVAAADPAGVTNLCHGASHMAARQLILDVTLPAGSGFESFDPGENALAVDSLRALAQGRGETQIYLYGESGSGKSHLLQAVCHESSSQGRRAAYLPPSLLVDAGARVLDGLESLAVVCLDGVGGLAGTADGETALFNLINRARTMGTQLVLSDRLPPRGLPTALADLASRLVWGPVYQLIPLGDAAKCAVLMDRAQRRGFELPREVGEYLLRTCPRDLSSLLEQLGRLERASLSNQRRVTLRFARSVLEAEERI
jgi:DnaA-homolog protein